MFLKKASRIIYKLLKKHLIEYLKLLQIQTKPALQHLRHIDMWIKHFQVSGSRAGRRRWGVLVGVEEEAFIEGFLYASCRDRCFYVHYFILVAPSLLRVVLTIK